MPWTQVSNIRGPAGINGAQGIQGPIGPPGPQGAASTVPGPAGPVGATGPQGPQGIQGATGPTGPAGPTGADSTVPGPQGIQGPAGPTGSTGSQGPPGQGVPVGGTTGQVLAKIDATNYNTQWVAQSGGGLTLPLGQNLTFAPDATYDIGNTTTTNRPRDLFLSRNASVAGSLTLTGNSLIQGTAIAQNFRVEATQSDLQLNSQTQAISLMTAATVRWQVSSAGNLVAGTDNTYDIGANAATRPRTVFVGTSVFTPTLLSPSGQTLNIGAGGNAWQITTSTHLRAVTDNASDIGASGANRPRDLFLGRDLYVTGQASVNPGQLGVGSAATTSTGIRVQSSTLAGTTQRGINSAPVFNSAATSTGAGVVAAIETANATFTMLNGRAFWASLPTLGAGSTVTNLYGVYADNQGGVGVTNAYGIYINAQSGASTTNIGLYNAGTTTLVGAVVGDVTFNGNVYAQWVGTSGAQGSDLTLKSAGTDRWKIVNTGNFAPAADNTYDIGGVSPYRVRDLYLAGTHYIGTATNKRIKTTTLPSLNIEAADGYLLIGSKIAPQITSNAYYDGTQWMRYDVAQAAGMVMADGNGGGLTYATAPVGANPISPWTTRMQLTNAGVLTVGGIVNNGTSQLVGIVNVGDGNVGVVDVSRGVPSGGFSMAPNAIWAPLGATNNFSGMLLIDETLSTGACGLFLSATGQVAAVASAQAATWFSTVKGTAGKINVYFDSTWSAPAIENKMASTINVQVMAFKTRSSQ